MAPTLLGSEIVGALIRITGFATATGDLTEVLRLTARELAHLTGADTVAAYLLDDAGVNLLPVAAYRVPKQDLRALALATVPVAEQGFYAPLFHSGIPVWSDDVAHDPRFGSTLFRSFPHQSGLGLPLTVDGAVRGVFYLVWWIERRQCDEATLSVLTSVAHMIGLLLRAAFAERRAAERQRRLELLVSLNRLISSSLDLEEVLAQIVKAAAALTGAPLAAFWLADEATGVVELRAASGLAAGEFPVRRLSFGEGGVGWVARHRRDLKVDDMSADGRFVGADSWRARGFTSFYALPVLIDDRSVAVLALFGTREIAVAADDASLLADFGAQAAVAIRNAETHDESRRRLSQVTALTEIARLASEELDPRRVAHQITSSLLTLLGVRSAWVLRLREPGGDLDVLAASGMLGATGAEIRVVPGGTGLGPLAMAGMRPVWSPDIVAEPGVVLSAEFRENVEQTGSHAVLVVPLVARGTVIGVIGMADRTGRHFTQPETDIAQALADQAAIAIDNAQLHEAAGRHAARMEALAEVGRGLAEELEPAAVAQRVAVTLRALLGARVATVFRLEPASGDLGALARSEDGGPTHGSGIVFPRGTGVVGRALETMQPAFSPNVLDDPCVRVGPAERALIEAAAHRSVLALPLIARGAVIGAIAVCDVEGRRFQDQEVQLAEAFAHQAALVLDNARLFETLARGASRMRGLAEVQHLLLESLDATVVPQLITRLICPLLGVRAAIAFRLDADSGVLDPIGVSDEAMRPRIPSMPPGMGASGLAVRDGRPVVTPDMLTDPRISLPPDWVERSRETGMAAVLSVPLMARGVVVGALAVGDRAGRVFTEEDVALAQIFANQAALALEHARIFAAEQTVRAEHEAGLARLQENEARLQALVERSPVGLFIHQGSIIRYANAVLAEMFGYEDPAMLIGRSNDIFLSPRERERIEGVRQARLRGEPVPARLEVENAHRDGTPVWVENQGSLVTWQGAPAILVTFVDVTERRRAQQALTERDEQLRQSQKMDAVGRLAGGVAHDFNNLLAVITGYAEILADGLPAGSPLSRSADHILGAARRAARLTHQLLAFSRRQVLQPEVVDLNALLGNFIGMLRRLIGEDYQLGTQFGAEVPSVFADPGQIEQVVMNLVLNARDAMPRGGAIVLATRRVSVDAASAGAIDAAAPGVYAEIQVQDEGVGMDAETRARIFEPFFTTKTSGKGTGLGLATVYGIVRQSRGFVRVESQPGAGSTFSVGLPASLDVPATGDEAQPPTAEARGHGTILVIEDDEQVRDLVAEVLEQAGYAVLRAADGSVGLELATTHPSPIDLVLSDVIMPGLYGPDLAARLATLLPAARVVFMSGYTDDALERAALDPTTVPLLKKPFTRDRLLQIVRRQLGERPR